MGRFLNYLKDKIDNFLTIKVGDVVYSDNINSSNKRIKIIEISQPIDKKFLIQFKDKSAKWIDSNDLEWKCRDNNFTVLKRISERDYLVQLPDETLEWMHAKYIKRFCYKTLLKLIAILISSIIIYSIIF